MDATWATVGDEVANPFRFFNSLRRDSYSADRDK
jgi:hypothetical protein